MLAKSYICILYVIISVQVTSIISNDDCSFSCCSFCIKCNTTLYPQSSQSSLISESGNHLVLQHVSPALHVYVSYTASQISYLNHHQISVLTCALDIPIRFRFFGVSWFCVCACKHCILISEIWMCPNPGFENIQEYANM